MSIGSPHPHPVFEAMAMAMHWSKLKLEIKCLRSTKISTKSNCFSNFAETEWEMPVNCYVRWNLDQAMTKSKCVEKAMYLNKLNLVTCLNWSWDH